MESDALTTLFLHCGGLSQTVDEKACKEGCSVEGVRWRERCAGSNKEVKKVLNAAGVKFAGGLKSARNCERRRFYGRLPLQGAAWGPIARGSSEDGARLHSLRCCSLIGRPPITPRARRRHRVQLRLGPPITDYTKCHRPRQIVHIWARRPDLRSFEIVCPPVAAQAQARRACSIPQFRLGPSAFVANCLASFVSCIASYQGRA